MKKTISLLLSALFLLGTLSACGSKPAPEASAEPQAEAAPEKLSIVTTIFPEYDWVCRVAEGTDTADVRLLLDNGVDLHSYQPTADDIMRIASCDLFIYVGGESDEWVEDALAEAANPDMKVISLLEVLGSDVKEEAVVEGMEAEEEEAESEEAGEEGPEYDEHVWLSLRNARVLSGVIADTLAELDPANAGLYQANAAAYCEALSALDAEYRDAVAAGAQDTLLFADRFPFRYLADDYGLHYYAAFAGCSAETEASFQTIVFLANKVDELGLNAVLQIESADGRIADTVCRNTAAEKPAILTMDSMQSCTEKDVENGVTYLSIMEQNLGVLKQALQ